VRLACNRDELRPGVVLVAPSARHLLVTSEAPLGEVLAYLVDLTEPLQHGDHRLPGWWTDLAPNSTLAPEKFPRGHANNGMAHGVAGVFAVLALSLRQRLHSGRTRRGDRADPGVARPVAPARRRANVVAPYCAAKAPRPISRGTCG
jgi:hypothetical protein